MFEVERVGFPNALPGKILECSCHFFPLVSSFQGKFQVLYFFILLFRYESKKNTKGCVQVKVNSFAVLFSVCVCVCVCFEFERTFERACQFSVCENYKRKDSNYKTKVFSLNVPFFFLFEDENSIFRKEIEYTLCNFPVEREQFPEMKLLFEHKNSFPHSK